MPPRLHRDTSSLPQFLAPPTGRAAPPWPRAWLCPARPVVARARLPLQPMLLRRSPRRFGHTATSRQPTVGRRRVGTSLARGPLAMAFVGHGWLLAMPPASHR
ncbi:hypothetical protein ZWY2020_043100 [Hordeum vulgare]|nr:hypothetical protein ZWY2020_043100 [Hordeum vulgare]